MAGPGGEVPKHAQGVTRQSAGRLLSYGEGIRERTGRGSLPIGSLWIPAVMAPLSGKARFECPPSHYQHLQSGIAEVGLILTVGWRAQEERFLSMLKALRGNPPDVYSVTAKGSASAPVVDPFRSEVCGSPR